MRKAAVALIILLAICASASAESDKPQLPNVPLGFDEGRTQLTREVKDGLIKPGALVERLFEEADLAELAAFINAHLVSDEKQSLDDGLKLEGKLLKQHDAEAVCRLLAGKKLAPGAVASAIGKMLEERKYTLADVAAWLYQRGYNFRVLQRAMNGERLDAFRLRKELRAMKNPTAADVIVPGMWEFNLDDAREQKGGHYSGVQLVSFLMKLGWSADDFSAVVKAQGGKDLGEAGRALVAWGDPVLVWDLMEPWTPESEFMKAAVAHYKQHDDPKVMQACLDRADDTSRWFRTGGPGVRAVYRGPWPDAQGNPRPPTSNVMKLGDLDAGKLAAALDKDIQAHFAKPKNTLTIVVYDDGSARAIMDKPRRTPIRYTADSPLGRVASTRQLYEGRVSLEGRSALFFLVFSKPDAAAPQRFELANVKLTAKDAFMLADIDDGLNLTPMLLRRVNPLTD